MIIQHTYSNALGICGNISSMFLFLSPLPTFIRIFRTKDVGQFTPAPYVLTVLNCGFWIVYGLPAVKNLILVISINSAGLVIEFMYVTIYMVYAKGETKRNTTTFIGLCCVLFAVITGVTLGVIHQHFRWKVIGAVCVSIGIMQNFAPLMVIRTVIRTKSAEYLPILLSIWIVINGGLWTAYGSWPYDVFIIIPNAFGIAFGVLQVVLWAVYCRNPKAPLDEALVGGIAHLLVAIALLPWLWPAYLRAGKISTAPYVCLWCDKRSWSDTVTDVMYGKTQTPDEKFALEDPDDPATDYFPESPKYSRLVGGERTYSFSPIAIFKLEELLEDMKANEYSRNEAERDRQKCEDERVVKETKRELAERARERQQKSRDEADKRRARECKRQGDILRQAELLEPSEISRSSLLRRTVHHFPWW